MPSDGGSIPPASTNSKTPTVPGWGFFLSSRADSLVVLGFLRKPADFAARQNWPFPATFHSLLAIPRSGLAP